jgi:hypothetical protein
MVVVGGEVIFYLLIEKIDEGKLGLRELFGEWVWCLYVLAKAAGGAGCIRDMNVAVMKGGVVVEGKVLRE